MLQETFQRLTPLLPPERIFVITNEEYVHLVHGQLPQLPADHAIGEPMARGTAAAVGLGAILAERSQQGAIMASVHADHLILKPDRFRAALVASAEIADRGPLVTLGIQPTLAHTGLGYVEQGEPLAPSSDGHTAYQVVKFTEKPDLATARRFVAGGRHSWNSGLFCWRVDRIMAEFSAHMPELHAGLRQIAVALGTPAAAETLHAIFPTLPQQTIDYGIMERAEDVAVLPVDIGWTDLGSWATLLDVLDADGQGNVVRGPGDVVAVDTSGSLIYTTAGRLIATVGVEGLIIVDTEDALLICPQGRAQDVREIVDQLQNSQRGDYLHGTVKKRNNE
jgi:mannose-1-phosphate guanylyltransferase